MTPRQKKSRATKEMNKFSLWMQKIKNVNFSDSERMSTAYQRVYNNFIT
jgi:hypothetical protein